MTPIPKKAIAFEYICLGKVDWTIAWHTGAKGAPKTPCNTRKKTKVPKELESPQASEATAKPMMA